MEAADNALADDLQQDSDQLAAVEQQWADEDLQRDQERSGGHPFEGERLADWYVGKLLSLDEEENRIKLQFEARVRALRGRRDGIRSRFGPSVENWLREKLASSRGKAKSVKLESGTVGFRAKVLSADWKDDDVVRRFAEDFEPAAEAFVMMQPPPKPEVKIKPLVAALQEWAKTHDGMLPDGIELTGGCDQMYVAPPK